MQLINPIKWSDESNDVTTEKMKGIYKKSLQTLEFKQINDHKDEEEYKQETRA